MGGGEREHPSNKDAAMTGRAMKRGVIHLEPMPGAGAYAADVAAGTWICGRICA